MPAETTHVKIYFELAQEQEGYPPDKYESLWAVEVGPGEFQVDNIPFYVRGISSGDIVAADRDVEGHLHFKSLIRSSGNSVFRLYVFDEGRVPELRKLLGGLGYESELSQIPNLIAVEISASKPIHPFLDLIVQKSEQGQLEYQEGALRHELQKPAG